MSSVYNLFCTACMYVNGIFIGCATPSGGSAADDDYLFIGGHPEIEALQQTSKWDGWISSLKIYAAAWDTTDALQDYLAGRNCFVGVPTKSHSCAEQFPPVSALPTV